VPITFELARQPPTDLEALVLPVLAEDLGGESIGLDWTFLRARGFEAKPGQLHVLPGELGIAVVAVGLGSRALLDAHALRRAGALAARSLRRQRVIATTLLDAYGTGAPPAMRAAAAAALVEGMVLASYTYGAYKAEPDRSAIERVVVLGSGGKRVQAVLDRAAAVAGAVCTARDLVNEPGGALGAVRLAEAAAQIAESSDRISLVVWDEARIREERLGGLLGVNRGSAEPPVLLELTYEPATRTRRTVALVGKGITFDSGGLSIKTADGMATMKDDMGGAAAILGAFAALDVVRPKVRVRAFIPATDNMISGDATRPGDVVRIRNNKTVEVLNTDAEGRLILADGLTLASEETPDAIIDVATLTGACEVALGKRIAGLMGNDAALVERIKAAAVRTGEPVWELPLPVEYRRQLDSDVADLRNIGTGRVGGALIAGLFLQEFVAPGIPWAHLDIAGPAWTDAAEGIFAKGGTGFGVRLILDLLDHVHLPAGHP
jgi:leucyl aminopeptidase